MLLMPGVMVIGAVPDNLEHMTPALILHIGAGSISILSGAAALSVRKGERLHRAFGSVFFLSMLAMSALGTYLAVFVPHRASVAVGILTCYLVATAWMTIRRKEGSVGLFEYGALLVVLSVAAALLIFGLQAAMSPTGRLEAGPPAPYYVFASFAAFAAVGDLKMILHGGISGAPRIARHLWRMCFALFFATAFFFLGQQKVMPVLMRGSPILLVPALAPLVSMTFWLVRVRLRLRSFTLAEFVPYGIQNAECQSEAKSQDPTEVPHPPLLR
jgi:hypothetical protein